MAEWFKASDLRPDINDAWVRTPLLAKIQPFFMIFIIMKTNQSIFHINEIRCQINRNNEHNNIEIESE